MFIFPKKTPGKNTGPQKPEHANDEAPLCQPVVIAPHSMGNSYSGSLSESQTNEILIQ
jgi:hypothetical protein